MDEGGLRKLSDVVEFVLRETWFGETVQRLKGELREASEAFVWATIAMGSIPGGLPEGLRSGWIFVLRRDVPSGAHYHPNSIQHMVMVQGRGSANIGGRRIPMVAFEETERPLAERWLIIDAGVAHEFTPERDDMVVMSFHTCEANDLVEIACGTGMQRHYEN